MNKFGLGWNTPRRAGLALALALLTLAIPLAPFAGSARAASTTTLHSATVDLGSGGATLAQLRAGDVVTGTINFELDPMPPMAWAWFAYVSAPGFHDSVNALGGQIQFSFTATSAGPFRVGAIGTGTAWALFTITRQNLSLPVPIGPGTKSR